MNLDTSSAVVVFSGGQDSTTCLGWALQRFEKVSAISFDYGQRHVIELIAAHNVVTFFRKKTERDIPHNIVKVQNLLESTSPLVSNTELETYEDHSSMEAVIGSRVEKTFVPMRNQLFLTIAANRAVATGAGNLVTGVCQEDNANYPDCRLNFIRALERATKLSLGIDRFDICTPLMYKTKAESVRMALDLPHTYEALAYSHTAYNGEYPPTGKDHASVLRAHGFEQADVPDPLVIRAWREGLMELPASSNYDAVREETSDADTF